MEAFSKQEGGYPDFPTQEPTEAPGQEKSVKKYFYVLIGVVVLAIALFIFFAGGPPEAVYNNGVCELEENCIDHPNDCKCKSNEVCSPEKKRCIRQDNATSNLSGAKGTADVSKSSYGNGLCEAGENCIDNPKDCRCGPDQYCSKEKKCIAPVCGNGICEGKKEGADTCCEDCSCPLADCQFCSPQTHSCEMPALQVSEEFVRAAVSDYYSAKGSEIGGITVKGDFCQDSKVYKLVEVEIAGLEFPEEVLVSETGEVTKFAAL